MSLNCTIYQVDDARLSCLLGHLPENEAVRLVDELLRCPFFKGIYGRELENSEERNRLRSTLMRVFSSDQGDYSTLEDSDQKFALDMVFNTLPQEVFCPWIDVFRGMEDPEKQILKAPSEYYPGEWFTFSPQDGRFVVDRAQELLGRKPVISGLAKTRGYRYGAASDGAEPGYFYVNTHILSMWLWELRALLDAAVEVDYTRHQILTNSIAFVNNWAVKHEVARSKELDELKQGLGEVISPGSNIPGDYYKLKYEILPVFQEAKNSYRGILGLWC